MTVKPQNLMPARPGEQKGWGRLKWIVSNLSTAPLELKLGFGSMWRGAWQFFPWRQVDAPHVFVWDGWLPLEVWGAIIAVAGFLQFFGCLYRWERTRTLAADVLAGSLVYIFGKYLYYEPGNIATVLYGTLMIGEMWIALRGWPVLGGKSLNGEVQDAA